MHHLPPFYMLAHQTASEERLDRGEETAHKESFGHHGDQRFPPSVALRPTVSNHKESLDQVLVVFWHPNATFFAPQAVRVQLQTLWLVNHMQ
jgi:hypothetical protein